MFVRNAALEARLVESPDDELAYEVYADWLCSQGSPHGELMQIQRWRQVDPSHAGWRRREIELLEEHAVALVGRLLAPRIRMLAWDAGYVRGIMLNLHELRELRDRPAGLMVQDIVVSAKGELQPVIDELVAWPPILRAIRIAAGPASRGCRTWALWRAQPQLVRAELSGGAFDLSGLESPILRALSLAPERLTSTDLRALASAKLPALEQLELSFSNDAGTRRNWPPPDAIQTSELRAVFDALSPSLHTLRLRTAMRGAELCTLLCNHPFAGRLRVLDLMSCEVGDEGARILANARGRFASIESLSIQWGGIRNRRALGDWPFKPD